MLREVVTTLGIHAVVQRNNDTNRRSGNELDEILLDLASLWSNPADSVATADPAEEPRARFGVTPAVTRSAARRYHRHLGDKPRQLARLQLVHLRRPLKLHVQSHQCPLGRKPNGTRQEGERGPQHSY